MKDIIQAIESAIAAYRATFAADMKGADALRKQADTIPENVPAARKALLADAMVAETNAIQQANAAAHKAIRDLYHSNEVKRAFGVRVKDQPLPKAPETTSG